MNYRQLCFLEEELIKASENLKRIINESRVEKPVAKPAEQPAQETAVKPELPAAQPAKASGRIGAGKRKDKPQASNADIHALLDKISRLAELSPEGKNKIQELKEHFGNAATVDKQLEQKKAIAGKGASVEAIQQKYKDAADKKLADRKAIQEAPATAVPQLGHEAQYIKDTEHPQMRSKAAAKLGGPVKERMATGEGIAVTDKGYGAALDAKRQIEDEYHKLRGPESTILVPGEFHDHPHVQSMLKLKETTPPENHPFIDSKINEYINKLRNEKKTG